MRVGSLLYASEGRTPVEQLQPFERGRIVGLRETGWTNRWTNRWIAAHVGHNVSVMCRCFQHWSVEHSRSLDQVPEGRIVQYRHTSRSTHCARSGGLPKASREEIRVHVAPVVSPRAIGNRLLAAGLRSRVSLARLPLLPRHR